MSAFFAIYTFMYLLLCSHLLFNYLYHNGLSGFVLMKCGNDMWLDPIGSASRDNIRPAAKCVIAFVNETDIVCRF